MESYKMYINGEWTESHSKNTFEDYSPVDGSVHANIADADRLDAQMAYDAAQKAFPAWAALSPEKRAEYLSKVADALENNSEEITKHLIDEVGSWVGKAKFECNESPSFFRSASKIAHMVKDELLESPIGKKSLVKRSPLGVVSVITPWNVPLNLSSRTTSGILAVGNTVVLKPSEESPITGGLLLAKAFEEAGVPPGVFNVVTSSRKNVSEVGDEMVVNPNAKAISFIGSTNVGRQIASKSGSLLIKASMELGGKDALVIMDDAPLDKAVNSALFGSFFHAGQICVGTKRIYVDETVAKEFTNRFVAAAKALAMGDVNDFSKPIGPLINEAALNNVKAQVEDAIEKGATVLAGGKHEGLYFEPTVLTHVTPEMTTYKEECFGPVVSIYSYKNIDHALEAINDSQYGLSGAVIAGSEEKAAAIGEKMESGMCHINDCTIYGEPLAPFGGVKNSGMGRYGGMASVEAYTKQRWVTIDSGQRKFPPPFTEKKTT